MLFVFWLNKQTDLKGQFHTVLLCLYVADPATSLASNIFSSENSLFIQLRKTQICPSLYNVVNITILCCEFLIQNHIMPL